MGGLCSNDTCVRCGGLGEPCCAGGAGYLLKQCPFAGAAMCLDGTCTACGRPGESCCFNDEFHYITTSGPNASCWGAGACSDALKCSADAPPAPEDADVAMCTARYDEATLGLPASDVHTAACMGAAANTECKDTVLVGTAGSRIIPDRCLDFSNRTIATFDCPAGTAAADASPIFCATSARTTRCGNTESCAARPGRDPGMACDTWSEWQGGVNGTLTMLKPGQAAMNILGGHLYSAVAMACNGQLQILSRPGIGIGTYTVFNNGILQRTARCGFICSLVPLRTLVQFGTTVAWVATEGMPASEAGAISKASAITELVDNGESCAGATYSASADRTVWEKTCLLLDSPDSVPSAPLFPDPAKSGDLPSEAASPPASPAAEPPEEVDAADDSDADATASESDEADVQQPRLLTPRTFGTTVGQAPLMQSADRDAADGLRGGVATILSAVLCFVLLRCSGVLACL
eukprot:jgi/Ulvmu1/6258/UM028_0116.1